jgi:transglutaminase-like putative cysteine protease
MSQPQSIPSRIRWGDWLSALILIILMQVAVGRLMATHWTQNLSLVQMTAFLGTLLGLLLGISVFRRLWVWFFTLAYGVIIIPWQLGLTLDVESGTTWLERLNILEVRLQVVAQELLTHKPVTDSILFLVLIALLFWVLSVYSGVILFREASPWKVVIPGGITIFVIHSFDPLLVSRSWYLFAYLFFTLLLIARLVFLKNAASWRSRHTHTPPDMGFDFIRMALVLSMVLIFFAWSAPVVAQTFKPAVQIWHTASQPWLTAKDRLSYMFASLRASVGLVQNYYGATLALGLGNPLSDSIMFEVEGPTNGPNGARFYWEARTYDTYEANQWVSTTQSHRALDSASADLNQPGADVRPQVIFTFFPYDPISNLYTVPEPLWVNLASQAYMVTNPDGSVDYSTMMSQDFVRPGASYEIRSAIDAVTISQLQAAGTDYPQWVTDSYLQLPGNITQRTRQLAANIAGDLSDPYDITNAVTEWLRNNIEYNLSISQPPPNQERIDWFLFDYKKGFCNYYASAEVVLLRSLGIPARMAVGFAEGQREIPPIQNIPQGAGPVNLEQISETSTYIVRQKDAHAWPEVFFPGIGWVIFEPTVSQPPLFRPAGETLSTQNERQTGAEAGQQDQLDANRNRADQSANEPPIDAGATTSFWTVGNIIGLVLMLFALAVIVIVIWQVRRGFKFKPFIDRISVEIPERVEKGLRRMGVRPPDFLLNWIYIRKLPELSRSYLEINRALNRLGKHPRLQDTPRERAATLITAIPETATPVERLLAEYQASVYSPLTGDPEAGRQAGNQIRRLSWLAWLKRLLSRFQEPEPTSTPHPFRSN